MQLELYMRYNFHLVFRCT